MIWMSHLAARTAASNPPDLDEYADLASEFPPDAFTQRSLKFVSIRFKFWPAYAELHEALT
jgi:hypothetical protein